jgi:predicted SnoaL-like aldol condensation-catalyzing enzyme
MSQQNKSLVRRIFEEGFNQGRLAVADEIFAPDFIDHSSAPGLPATGPESFRQTAIMFRSAFPDVRATIDDLIATLTAIDIVRVVDGKVVEHWGNEDDLGMLAQLGIVTPPA